jgi:hypothetical protein
MDGTPGEARRLTRRTSALPVPAAAAQSAAAAREQVRALLLKQTSLGGLPSDGPRGDDDAQRSTGDAAGAASQSVAEPVMSDEELAEHHREVGR